LQVIDVTAIDAKGRIVFGSTVTLLDEETDKEIIYKLVGEDEADIKTGMISFSSPIARALIGNSEGDVVSFQAPGGEKTFEVLEVKYV
jgi:transcription elongation factor GreA